MIGNAPLHGGTQYGWLSSEGNFATWAAGFPLHLLAICCSINEGYQVVFSDAVNTPAPEARPDRSSSALLTRVPIAGGLIPYS
jgi:hypothetical protein